MVKPHVHAPKAAPAGETSTLMSDSEFDSFWALLYARREAGAHPGPRPGTQARTADPLREEASHRGRSSKPTPQRCGTCRGCAANDCGTCKNCRDKPRFGGPGIKKKACLRRVCYKLRDGDEEDDEDDDEEQEEEQVTAPASSHARSSGTWQGAPVSVGVEPPTGAAHAYRTSSTSEPPSEVTSPRLRPSSPPPSGSPTAELTEGASCETPRTPLEALPAEPNGVGQLDVLSRMASRETAT